MGTYGETLFKGTATYYARYRPLYPSDLVRFLVSRFRLDGKGRLLDLGCGTGQLAMRFTDWCDQIVGMDPELEMLQEAARLSAEMRVTNVSWVHGRAEELATAHGLFQLVTIASAFHWMDRARVLEILHDMVSPDGGVAIVDYRIPPPPPWSQKVQEVVKRWLGEARRAGDGTYTHPELAHEEIAAASPFAHVAVHQLPTYEHVWNTDEIIGYLYSTSFASQRLFGDSAGLFEADLRETLMSLNPDGRFTEPVSLSVLVLSKQG